MFIILSPSAAAAACFLVNMLYLFNKYIFQCLSRLERHKSAPLHSTFTSLHHIIVHQFSPNTPNTRSITYASIGTPNIATPKNPNIQNQRFLVTLLYTKLITGLQIPTKQKSLS
eukprot:191151_1